MNPEHSTKGITHKRKNCQQLNDYKNIPLADYKQLNAQR